MRSARMQRAVLPLLESHSFTFLIEDPATVWNLGPQRYQTIAERYRELTPHREKLAIDVNIVDRYQDVYPTKQQTGTELFELVHEAAANFGRVALYFENSLLPPDLGVAAIGGGGRDAHRDLGGQDGGGFGAAAWGFRGKVRRWWMARRGRRWTIGTVWLPAGRAQRGSWEVGPGGPRLVRLNGDLEAARCGGAGDARILATRAAARAIAVLDRVPQKVEIDGVEQGPASKTLLLPRGQHFVSVTSD